MVSFSNLFYQSYPLYSLRLICNNLLRGRVCVCVCLCLCLSMSMSMSMSVYMDTPVSVFSLKTWSNLPSNLTTLLLRHAFLCLSSPFIYVFIVGTFSTKFKRIMLRLCVYNNAFWYLWFGLNNLKHYQIPAGSLTRRD